MSGMKIGKVDCIPHLSLMFLILFLSFLRPASCANGDDDDDDFQSKNLNGRSLVTALIYTQISNLTKIFRSDITRTLGYCIKNVDADLNGAFKFGSNLDFLDNCVKQTKDLTQRICTAAEMKFYFTGFMDHKSGEAQILKPNRNCNLTYWISGCEPGWASSVPPNVKVDIRNSQIIPQRSHNSQPCCEGFFCPRGLTCMIPCPLGAYCPSAKLNKTTGICDPYLYQLPPGKINHTCGGADVWASVTSSEEIFCSGGYFCPTTTTKVPCSRGHYCRMGFTAEKACMKLNSCNSKTADQNLHAFGFLLIGALTFILFLIYNCSDQVINTRYKRLAKSREAAARSARETAQARERWKSAKNVAKKGIELPRQISRTISRKTSKKQEVLPPKAPNIQSKGVTKVKKKEPGPLTKMVHSLENDSEEFKGFNMEIGDRNIKKQTPKTKQLHTKSQIFKYAYGQLEKEKAMEQNNENLTFSSVISMATDTEVRTRMTIEVAFKDLTLTLKGKNKHLMRSVTGKLSPGRISAVMGPSGAGKTTFLSSVMGKTAGCTMTGSILINGKSDPIQSYKKIVGFVPQDDIVHGNLTVEENLRFSARCRLAEDLPKADKVLVVERVIEALGLQGVRESLVGNVQKRGISGGQRKRVNVGLEMVMEPSLLILDEPTTGLDSSSSNLLLKALRREALEGVNICMVVHQPSYTLFKAFDDLILLAKGGLIVYHGPVKKVEEYFAGIGINVPERVNPPDHLIDILEGFEKPPEGLSVQQLPVRWMLHNGYHVPHDMMPLLDQIGSSSKAVNSGAESSNSSFGGDPWKEKQRSTNYLLNARDLSNRVTPGVLRQYRYYLGRVSKQKLRESDIQAVDYIILLLAGACLGRLSKVKGDTFGYRGYMYTIIAVSLLCKVAALRSFSLDKLEYWRERSSGMSSLAYFLSKDTIDLFNMVVKPLVFLSMFYFLSTPRSTFGDNYVILLCLVYCVNGIAYVFAIVLEPGPAQLWCVLLPVVLTLIATMDPDAKMAKIMGNFCYTKWALEAFVIANAQRYSGVWLITRCGTLLELGFNVNNYARCLVFLLLTGVGFRVLAYLCLVAKR